VERYPIARRRQLWLRADLFGLFVRIVVVGHRCGRVDRGEREGLFVRIVVVVLWLHRSGAREHRQSVDMLAAAKLSPTFRRGDVDRAAGHADVDVRVVATNAQHAASLGGETRLPCQHREPGRSAGGRVDARTTAQQTQRERALFDARNLIDRNLIDRNLDHRNLDHRVWLEGDLSAAGQAVSTRLGACSEYVDGRRIGSRREPVTGVVVTIGLAEPNAPSECGQRGSRERDPHAAAIGASSASRPGREIDLDALPDSLNALAVRVIAQINRGDGGCFSPTHFALFSLRGRLCIALASAVRSPVRPVVSSASLCPSASLSPSSLSPSSLSPSS